MRNNKKWFTLIEIIIVIAAISLLITVAYSQIGKVFSNNIDQSSAKDYLVLLLSEVEWYSYNSVTVGQELLNEDTSLNTSISRFSSDSALAYYHGLYFTTNPSDPIDVTLDNGGKNKYIYLTQYEQEAYGSIVPRELQDFNPDPSSSPQLLSLDNYDWAKRYTLPSREDYYLYKITGSDQSCTTGPFLVDWFVILFSSASLSFTFYTDSGEEKGFDYKLCYSEEEDALEDGEIYLEVPINRESLKEFYFESLRNY